MVRTKFPVKALATLRALGENITPIPVPDIVVPPTQKRDEFRTGHKKGGGGGGAGAGSRQEPMEVD